MSAPSQVFDPVVLEGDIVRLEPVCVDHVEPLREAVRDGELWKLFVTIVPPPDQIEAFVSQALQEHQNGRGLAFATIDRASGRVVGSTRFMQADLPHKKVEIGFTFIAESFQKSKVNTQAKLLMLTHAFETLGLNRVEFLTDYLNTNSRRAILRLGAKEEGVLRSHRVMPNGRVRDSVLFSIVKHEWPGVRENLLYKLAS